uniref:Uncharacterized protein n=1 Tax=Scophthalmus maximus TaxID=52904 RepID=A0A8D2ZKJ9_SCOMX
KEICHFNNFNLCKKRIFYILCKCFVYHLPSPDHVSHEEEEGISGGGNHTHHNVGISVEELDAFLQTPEAALQTAQQELGELVLVVQILQQNPDDLNYGQNEGAERQTSCVIPTTRQRKPAGRKHWEGGHVAGLVEGPVVRGESPGQRHLSQSDDEVSAPEEEEDVVELQGDQVLVVNRFSSVERKEALGVRALRFHRTGPEGLMSL